MRPPGIGGGPARPPGPVSGAEARQPTVRLPGPIRGGRARAAKAHQLEGTTRGAGPEARVAGVLVRTGMAGRTGRAGRLLRLMHCLVLPVLPVLPFLPVFPGCARI